MPGAVAAVAVARSCAESFLVARAQASPPTTPKTHRACLLGRLDWPAACWQHEAGGSCRPHWRGRRRDSPRPPGEASQKTTGCGCIRISSSQHRGRGAARRRRGSVLVRHMPRRASSQQDCPPIGLPAPLLHHVLGHAREDKNPGRPGERPLYPGCFLEITKGPLRDASAPSPSAILSPQVPARFVISSFE